MLKLIAAVVLVVALGAATYALAGGNDGHAKRGQNAGRGHDAREAHGPPPWAKAYGFRCKEAGNRPGSQAFKDCIKAKKR